MVVPTVGFSSWAFPGEPVTRSIDHALAHDFGALEIALLDPAQFDTDELLPSDEQARAVAQRTAGMRMSVHAPILQISLADLDPAIRDTSVETMRRTIHAAHLMHAEVVVCHLSRRDRNTDVPLAVDESGRGYAAEHLRQLGAEAADAGIVLAVENVGISSRAADRDYAGLCDLVTTVGLDNVGLTLDVGHAHVHSQRCGGVGATARLFNSLTRHYHVHDNDGSADQHLRIGAGSIDFADLIPGWAAGFEGILIMEVFPFHEQDMTTATLASRDNLIDLIRPPNGEGPRG
jgi:sugar phosphate isomerase/epimerase